MGIERWFEESREAIERVFGEDADLFCKLLAGTSPISTIESNMSESVKAYRQLKWLGRLVRETFIFSRYSCMMKLLNGEPTTRKVGAMYQNMIGNEQVCPIDRWMMRYFGCTEAEIIRGISRDVEYDWFENKIKAEAAKLGITPARRQVQIWCTQRGDDTSYGDIINRKELSKENILRRLL